MINARIVTIVLTTLLASALGCVPSSAQTSSGDFCSPKVTVFNKPCLGGFEPHFVVQSDCACFASMDVTDNRGMTHYVEIKPFENGMKTSYFYTCTRSEVSVASVSQPRLSNCPKTPPPANSSKPPNAQQKPLKKPSQSALDKALEEQKRKIGDAGRAEDEANKFLKNSEREMGELEYARKLEEEVEKNKQKVKCEMAVSDLQRRKDNLWTQCRGSLRGSAAYTRCYAALRDLRLECEALMPNCAIVRCAALQAFR